MVINTIKMNVHGVEIANNILDHRECIKHFFALHYYIYNNIYRLDYPPELLFDNSILKLVNEQIFDDPPELLFYDSIFKEEYEWLVERRENEFYEQRAINKLKQFVSYLKSTNYKKIEKNTYVVAYDVSNGYMVVAKSEEQPKKINKIIKVLANKVGKIGSKPEGQQNVIGCCAEFITINALLNKGCKLENIRLTRAYKFKNSKSIISIHPYCDNCKQMFQDTPVLKKGHHGLKRNNIPII